MAEKQLTPFQIYQRKWYRENREAVCKRTRERLRRWRAENPELNRERSRRHSRNRRINNPEAVAEMKRRHYILHKDKIRAKQKVWYEKNRDKVQRYNKSRARQNWLIRRYSLTIEEWNAMFRAQGRRCAACGSRRANKYRRGWHVDHCHRTGKIRAILCFLCNSGIGKAKDDIKTLRKWVAYLERHA
jgi:hypothetical protein